MAKSKKLGGGGRFEALKDKLAARPGVTDPAAGEEVDAGIHLV